MIKRFSTQIKSSVSSLNTIVVAGLLAAFAVVLILSQFGIASAQVVRQPVPSTNSINQDANKSEKDSYKLIFGGDVMLARTVGYRILVEKFDPFSQVADVLRSADLAVVNLECVVSTRGFAAEGKPYTFRADPRTLKVLQSAGIDAVSLANNHSGDYGVDAFKDMFKQLTAYNIGYFGGGNNASEAYAAKYVVVRNLKVALLGFVNVEIPYFAATDKKAGVAWIEDDKVKAAITEARQNSDLVIVVPHWGTEYTDQITSEQQRLAHLMIDAGADLVVGSHPHHIQQTEIYNGKTIVYSMGNFIFDGPGPNIGWYLGRLVEVSVEKSGGLTKVTQVTPLDYKSNDKGQPKLL
jgi:poly-gamma-glutamate synthesis protein (capsule biosynthesis protein)